MMKQMNALLAVERKCRIQAVSGSATNTRVNVFQLMAIYSFVQNGLGFNFSG